MNFGGSLWVRAVFRDFGRRRQIVRGYGKVYLDRIQGLHGHIRREYQRRDARRGLRRGQDNPRSSLTDIGHALRSLKSPVF
jgi:hypothetical protein